MHQTKNSTPQNRSDSTLRPSGTVRDFIRYATANVLGMVGLSCYILADTYFVAKAMGADGLAALNLAIPAFSFINGCGMMLGIGGATRYSILKSTGDDDAANRIFTDVLRFGLLLACCFMLLGAFCSGPIARMLGADKDVFAMTNTYLKVLLLFSPSFIVNDIFLCFVRNDGAPRLAMLGMLLGSFANIILDYILIFPLHLDILGAVLATGIAPVVSLSVLNRHRRQKHHGFHLTRARLQLRPLLKATVLGIPSLITELSSGIVIIVFNIIILGLEGNLGLAAYGVITNLSIVVVSIYTGIGQGVQPLLSHSYGKGDRKSIRLLMRCGILTLLLLSLLVYAAVYLFADPITAVFNSEHDPLLQEIAADGLKLYFLAGPFIGLNILIGFFFTSTEKPWPAHIISYLRGFLLIIPMAFLMAHLAALTGVWLTVPVTEALVFLPAFLVYRKSNFFLLQKTD